MNNKILKYKYVNLPGNFSEKCLISVLPEGNSVLPDHGSFSLWMATVLFLNTNLRF